jgi:uncharacterized protein (TIGR03032 family)
MLFPAALHVERDPSFSVNPWLTCRVDVPCEIGSCTQASLALARRIGDHSAVPTINSQPSTFLVPVSCPSVTTPTFSIQGSRQFVSWLREQQISLAFTTYQSGKLFLLGTREDGSFSVFERTFERCMGLCVDGAQTLWLATLYQLWRFENALPPGQSANGFDRLYVPQLAYTTGDVDVHDIALDLQRRPVFMNTLFSCLAAPSETHSFRPLWKPSFISRLAAEDRCHLNGLAMENGVPRYATAVSTTDVHEGWREHRQVGGVLIDIVSSEILARGFSMPHSPRLHEGKLYVLNSGAGEFGTVDLQTGKFQPICFCPGYARGLSFHGHFAVIGLSTCRESRTFQGLPLDEALAQKNVAPRCGLQIVDLRTGDAVHSLWIEGVVRELYDVAVLPGVQRPSALGFKTEEIRRTITMEE